MEERKESPREWAEGIIEYGNSCKKEVRVFLYVYKTCNDPELKGYWDLQNAAYQKLALWVGYAILMVPISVFIINKLFPSIAIAIGKELTYASSLSLIPLIILYLMPRYRFVLGKYIFIFLHKLDKIFKFV